MAVGLVSPSFPDKPASHDDANDGDTSTRWNASDILLAAQLGILASQHHRSDYSFQKYGVKGAPVAYVPLSLQYPDHYQQLLDQQAAYEGCQAWWPSRRLAQTRHDAHEQNPRNHEPTIIRHTTTSYTLQEDLLNALTSPLTPQIEIPSSNAEQIPPIKTSHSHPLNISMLIPPELLSVITSHLKQATPPSPVMFDLPLSIQLHRGMSLPIYRMLNGSRQEMKREVASEHSMPGIRKVLRPNSVSFVNLLWNQKLVRKTAASPPSVKSSHSVQPPQYAISVTSTIATCTSARASSVVSSAVGLSLAARAPPLPAYSCIQTSNDEKATQDLTDIMPGADITCGPAALHRRTVSSIPASQPACLLGNLFLSSCPGKKVRLNGPVNGRGGVCRDLRHDLRRIKELGVGCVVCCLDDEELQYLGAPWEEYAQAADELCLDVLRIPTPEGLAPPDAALLDAHLTQLIERYTLRGVPVLVHCRGGVGRAGLVACCWALKLGLCGWLETPVGRASRLSCTAPEDLGDAPPQDGVRRDTLLLIERAITLVRRRRSPKAVETFEQVKFLAEYVDYLRAQAAPRL